MKKFLSFFKSDCSSVEGNEKNNKVNRNPEMKHDISNGTCGKDVFSQKNESNKISWEIAWEDIIFLKENIENPHHHYRMMGRLKIGINNEIDVYIKNVRVDCHTATRDIIIKEVLDWKRLNSPYILNCYGCCFQKHPDYPNNPKNEVAFIIYEFCPRGNIREYIQNKDFLFPVHKMKLIFQISEAMEFLHSKSTVHYNLKPENILIGDDERVRIDLVTPRKRMKQLKGRLVGTPVYLSPEQFYGREIGNKESIDIYSFGMICWEIWTGKKPLLELQTKFKYNTFKFLCKVHGEDCGDGENSYKRPDTTTKEKLLVDCPEFMIELMKDCWDDHPDGRPDSFSTILEELMEIMNEFDSSLFVLRDNDYDEKERVEYIFENVFDILEVPKFFISYHHSKKNNQEIIRLGVPKMLLLN